MPSLSNIFTIIPPAKIAYLKFILEGYDGLAVISTVNQQLGIVSFAYYPARKNELLDVLLSVQLTNSYTGLTL